MPQREAAALFALATLVGTGLYEPAGALTKRYGATVVLLMSYIVRGLALATVAIAILLHASVLWAAGGFVVIVVTWSFLAVAGNARIAALAPAGAAGAALGAVAAAATLARAAGNLAAVAVVAHVGYSWIVAVGAALLGAAAAWAVCEPRGGNSR